MIMGYLKFVLVQYAVTVGWAIAGALSMGVGLGVALKAFTMLTPKLNEMEELRKGNVAVSIVLAAVILAMAIVIAVTVMPEAAK
jgi:uncharacterized membrane protein YjfL (UPF0719 family)